MKARLLIRLLLLTLVLVPVAARVDVEKEARLFRDGKEVAALTDFQAVGETVFLPLSQTASALELKAFANSKSRIITIKCETAITFINAATKEVRVGPKTSTLRLAPIWTAREIYVPHRAFTDVVAPACGFSLKVEHEVVDKPDGAPAEDGKVKGLRDPVDVIVIDPGHGGEHKGAKGPGGVLEKDVALVLARKLKERLEKEEGLTVHLTRDKDVTMSLAARPKKARKLGADVFISLHANAFSHIGAKGFETFFASLNATDEAAFDLARWENRVEEGGGETPDPVMDDLEMILGDMAESETLVDSERLAELIQGSLAKVMKSDNRGVKQAPFSVLLDAAMPSVLVEVGFLTSPKEAKKITDPATQDKIVEAMGAAVLKYRDETNARLGLSSEE